MKPLKEKEAPEPIMAWIEQNVLDQAKTAMLRAYHALNNAYTESPTAKAVRNALEALGVVVK